MMPALRHVPLPLRLYTAISSVIGPLMYARVAKKLQNQGTSPERIEERKGYATEARPEGRLVWCHAASVGESLSVLRLIAQLGEQHSDVSFLLTSGTATSAQIVASRLPPHTQHQFAPMDTPRAVDRFISHWAPDAAIFVESELWPNMLTRAHLADIPLALVNARISDGSARNWARAPTTAQHLMQNFRMIHCQDERTAEHLHGFGLPHAAKGPNLKAMSAPLPVDMKQKAKLEKDTGGRPIWLASSTHPGEDEIVLEAHQKVLESMPDALLILVPRHPERVGDIAHLIEGSGMTATQRSRAQGPEAQVYIADTLGETGLWYSLSPITCLCGSFTPVGGHNPFEPAQGGSAILHGPLYANFSQVYQDFDEAEAAIEVRDATDLSAAILSLLSDPPAREKMTKNAATLADAQNDGLIDIARDLSKALDLG